MQSLIRNTARLTGGTVTKDEPLVIDKVAYHVQQAMQMLRDDPVGDLKWEQHCTKIYQVLTQAMELLVTQPRASSALQSDLAAVMGGVDGTTQVSQVQEGRPSTPK